MSSDAPSDRSAESPIPALSTGGERPTNVRWLIFALACATSFFLYLHRYTWNVIGPELKKDYGYSNKEVQTLGSIFNWTYGAAAVPSGVACDLIGPHFFLGGLIILWSAALAGHLFTGSTAALTTTRLVFGLTQAGCYPAISKSTQIWFRPATRTVLQGWIAAAFGRGGGAMSSILMGTILIGYFQLSWQHAILVMSGMGIVFGVIFLMLFRGSPAHDPRVNDAERAIIDEGREPTAAGGSNVLPWGRALRNRSILMCLLQQFHGAGADSFYSITLGSYFQDGWKLSKAEAGVLISLPLFGGALGGIAGAYLNDILSRSLGRRWGRSVVGVVGSLIASILMLTVILQPTPVRAAWMLFVVKFFMDWNQPSIWGTVTDIGGRYTATVFSIVNVSGTIGSVVIPPLIGVILDATKSPSTGDPQFAWVIAVVAGLYFVSALSWLGIDCTKRVEQPAAA